MKHTHSQTQPACAISFKTLSHMMIQETQRISNKQNRSLIHLETQLLHGAIIQLNCGVPIFPAYDFDRLWSFFETVIHTYYLPGDLYPRFLYSVDMILELRSVPGLLVLLCIADKVDKGSFQNDFNRTWESRARSPYTHPHSTLKNRGKAKPNTHITLSPTLPPSLCKHTDLSISLGNKHVRSRKWESVPLDMKISNWKNKLHSLTSHLFDVALRSFVSEGLSVNS